MEFFCDCKSGIILNSREQTAFKNNFPYTNIPSNQDFTKSIFKDVKKLYFQEEIEKNKVMKNQLFFNILRNGKKTTLVSKQDLLAQIETVKE